MTVGIIVGTLKLQNALLEVDRRSDRLIRVLIEGVITNLISVYVPQAECSVAVKDTFQEQYGEVLLA